MKLVDGKTNSRPKTCSTCAHNNLDRCMLSGYYTKTERQFPTVCGVDFHGWVQKEGFLTRVVRWFKG